MIEHESSSANTGGALSESGISDGFESHPIGEYLRRQRVLRGISTEELASITRIPLRSLERLESGQFDGETDGFVRGFVRTVASALGLDADDAISRMLLEPDPGNWERHSPSRSLKQSLVGLVLVLLLVVTFFVMRAGWNVLLGAASTPGSSDVVIWQDPVRALAEATGLQLDGVGEIDPSSRPSTDSEIDASEASRTTMER